MTYIPLTHLDEPQVEELRRLYRNEWWTSERRREDVLRMLKYTDAVVAFADPDSGELVAFSRILSDRVFKAFVFDVIVHPDHRGRGLGRMLFDAVMGHEMVAGVEHVELYCRPDLEPFYERWGFTSRLGDLRFMRKERQ